MPQPNPDPRHLTWEQVAELLDRELGGQGAITAAMIEADVGSGAGLNPDGTVDLARYCSWLAKREE